MKPIIIPILAALSFSASAQVSDYSKFISTALINKTQFVKTSDGKE